MKLVVYLLCFLCAISTSVVNAQETQAQTASVQITPQDPSTLDQRLALAKKMHDIRPTRDQVYIAIDQVASGQPENEREPFRQAMRNILNYKAIEKISIDAMAETYTPAELTAMVDYYSKPEAKSASDKDQAYAAKVYPEIVRMLDQAMMRVKTGAANESAPN
jgi:hypothetical protein